MPQKQPSVLLTFEQAAEIAGISHWTIRRACASGARRRLRVVVFGPNLKRIRPADLETWMQKLESK